MKQFALSILMAITINLAAQNSLSPRPDPVSKTYRFFYFDSSEAAKSVSVTGSFNGWNPGSHPLFKVDKNLWQGSVKLTTGEKVFYKFVLDGRKWIPDPNAPYITQDQWRNSVLIAIDTDAFGLLSTNPMDEGTVIKPEFLILNFYDPHRNLEVRNIGLLLNGKQLSDFMLDSIKSQIVIPVAEKLQGHQTLYISIKTERLVFEKKIHFYAQTNPAEITTPEENASSVIYEIFVRQYHDGNNDGIGDFVGLTEKLDYIKSLGADILWLMPVQESPRDHGYAITDYRKIKKEYGGDEAYRKFIREAHKKGMKVWMDFVINHSDSTHPFFLDVVEKGKQSEYWNWYQMTNENPLRYNHFGSDRRMPKFNFENPEVENYFIELALYWMDPDQDGDYSDGFDGFRCDAAIEVPHHFWKKLRASIKKKTK